MNESLVSALIDKWFEGYKRALDSGKAGEDAVIATNIWMNQIINGGNK